MVRSSADSLLTVINEVLDFSKIEAGRLDFDLMNSICGIVSRKMFECSPTRRTEKVSN